MKLLICKACKEVFNLKVGITKVCCCGASRGSYIDETNAVYEGPCVPIGFENLSFRDAIVNRTESGEGVRFDAFIIPRGCPTFVKK